MGKTKKKTNEQSRICEGSTMDGVCSKNFWKRWVLSFEWKRVEVMDSDSGDDGPMGEMSLDDCDIFSYE